MIRFVLRNPEYAIQNWRSLAAVRRAMAKHKALHPTCSWCGTTRKIETHHVIPVAVEPAWAAFPSNMASVCRRCHFTVAHIGNWKKYIENVRTLCEVADRVRIVQSA